MLKKYFSPQGAATRVESRQTDRRWVSSARQTCSFRSHCRPQCFRSVYCRHHRQSQRASSHTGKLNPYSPVKQSCVILSNTCSQHRHCALGCNLFVKNHLIFMDIEPRLFSFLSPSILIIYRQTQYSTTFSVNILPQTIRVSLHLGVKMTKFVPTPKMAATGAISSKGITLLNIYLCLYG